MEEWQACDERESDFVGLAAKMPDGKGVTGFMNKFQ
jgi:hypothetical protein